MISWILAEADLTSFSAMNDEWPDSFYASHMGWQQTSQHIQEI